jgi:hypothetical protein
MQLKDILGKPNQGIHRHFLGIALADALATVVVGGLLGWCVSWWAVLPAILGLFVLGEFLHYVIGVDTAVMRFIGIREK